MTKATKKRKIRACVYCGKNKPVSREHVVPKCLFIKPYPPNLVTVSACDECNNEKSRDDDFLRDFIVFDNYTTSNPIAKSIFLNKSLSSQRRGSSVVAKEAVKNAKLQPLYTKGGIYMGDFYGISVDEQRLKRTFERLIQGLYYDSQKKLFPRGYELKFHRHFPWEFRQVIEDLSSLNLRKKTWGNVFGCAFAKAMEDPFSTAWLFWFYDRVMFSVFMTNPELSRSRNWQDA